MGQPLNESDPCSGLVTLDLIGRPSELKALGCQLEEHASPGCCKARGRRIAFDPRLT